MDLNYSAAEEAFRQDVRQWLGAHLPKDLAARVRDYQELGREDLLRWHRILAEKGWVAPAWPEEWGGTGWGAVERYIFEEECGLAAAPPLVPFGLAMCGPVLIRFGSQAIKERFLPRIYRGEDFWCQGYSEPGSGSDLASLKTRAERRGDKYIVNGQKIWTTLGHFADWIFCLVRTDTETRIRQEGISFLLIDMKSPGISVRPLMLMDGHHEVNEVFFDNVEVPVDQLVHEEGKGWTVAKFLLGHERLNTGRVGISKRELQRLKEWAAERTHGGKPWMDDPRFADKVAELEIDLMALEITNLRFLDQLRGGRPPGAEVSMLKLRGTEIQQRLTELMMEVGGSGAERLKPVDSSQWADDAFDRFAASLGPRYANFRKTSIYAGSNEIQRNIMAKMMLGL
jgi:alkylation response protein AidB-like acyl-CoA dehydrogenase